MKIISSCRNTWSFGLHLRPCWAVETFYIMFDNSMKGQPGACKVMTCKARRCQLQDDGRIQVASRSRRRNENDERVRIIN